MVYPAEGLRIARPPTLSYPIKADEVAQLNKYLEDLWNMQSGRYEMDVVTSAKTAAKNGEVYLIQTGSTVYMQYRANNTIFTITPDGY